MYHCGAKQHHYELDLQKANLYGLCQGKPGFTQRFNPRTERQPIRWKTIKGHSAYSADTRWK